MKKGYEKKHYFMVGAIALFILSPLIIWLLPYILQRAPLDMGSVWIIETPAITYRFFGIAWLFLMIGSVASYFFYKQKIVIVIGCVIIAMAFMYIGLKPINVMSTAGFYFVETPFEDEIKYSWEDVEKVYLVIDEETREQSLEFHYKDNHMFIVENRNDVQSLRSIIMDLKNTYGFSFTTKE